MNTDWLKKNINQIKIVDCSLHIPGEKRNAEKEFRK